MRSLVRVLIASSLLCLLCQCSSSRHLKVSIADQKMAVMKGDKIKKTYKISTSKFGIGDRRNSNYTPLGKMRIAKKIGGGHRAGTVFKSRRPTGEVIKPNAPGRDPIVTRILWLSGLESQNRNCYKRYIYIHGTPEEKRLGHPASYGCIRMRSRDIIRLYRKVRVGTRVNIVRGPLK